MPDPVNRRNPFWVVGVDFFFRDAQKESKRRKRHGSAPTKIIPWSVSWHPMIVRQRLEWSLGVHVRLARVSCGATLPIPDCLQTVTSYQGHASYNYIPTLASSYFISLSLSLLLVSSSSVASHRRNSTLPAPCPLLFRRGANCKRRASQPSRSREYAGKSWNRERHDPILSSFAIYQTRFACDAIRYAGGLHNCGVVRFFLIPYFFF